MPRRCARQRKTSGHLPSRVAHLSSHVSSPEPKVLQQSPELQCLSTALVDARTSWRRNKTPTPQVQAAIQLADPPTMEWSTSLPQIEQKNAEQRTATLPPTPPSIVGASAGRRRKRRAPAGGLLPRGRTPSY